jgi:hypothetical protein
MVQDNKDEGPTVTLNYVDLIEITNTMNNTFPAGQRPSQGYLEWNLMDAIRKHTDTNFFVYLKELEDKKPD